jgi:hypothetical protein
MSALIAQHGKDGPALIKGVMAANGGDLEAALGALDELGPAPAGNDLDAITSRMFAEQRLLKGAGR